MNQNFELLCTRLGQAFMNCSEVLPKDDVAKMITEVEDELDCEFSTEEILRAFRSAANYFVDSYLENSQQTFESEQANPPKYPWFESYADYDAHCARFEAMRPLNIRKRELLEIL